MKILTIFFLFAALFLGCKKAQIQPTAHDNFTIPWADSSQAHPKNTAFKALLEKYNRKGLPGISLLVNDKQGTWIGSVGKADIERDVPFTVGQVSKLASITKLFMGVLTFKLMEDSVNTGLGYKALNTKINAWLPASITNKIANGNSITLGQCLNHETGVPDLIEEDAFYLAVLNNPNKIWKAEDLLTFIYDKPAVFLPGDTAIYSNTNTTLVSMVIEAATGKKHSDLLKQYILNPLQLKNTFYQPHDVIPNTVAQGYFDLYNNNTIVNVSNLVPGSGHGYNGIYSNVFDLFKFIDELLIKKTLLKRPHLQSCRPMEKVMT